MQVLTINRVAESLATLRKLGAHRNTIMYLCIKRAATEQRITENIKVDFREFFERFLTVRSAPTDKLNKPYIMPFEESNVKLWLNRNLAGSFAPSSIRPDNPINTVISINGIGAKVTYSLKPDHQKYALANLLRKIELPALDLAIFLYRDFGFYSDAMNAEILLTIFKAEFGYLEDRDYTKLFSCNPKLTSEPLFTPFIQN